MIGNHIAVMVILSMMADHDARHSKKWKMYDPALVRAWFDIVEGK
jgi:hypothetical protein